MKEEKIRPIPKYILKRIQKLDKLHFPKPDGVTRYYSYLTKNDGELVKITVAARHYQSNWYYKQVAVHGIHSERCFVKDMVYYTLGGYHTGWYSEGITKIKKWYEYDEWGWSENKYFDPYAPCVNREYAEKLPKYKYCALTKANMEVMKYMRLYEKYPQIEYLTKAGLTNISDSIQILKKVGKDINFRKYLYKNADDIRKSTYYIQSILKAYKTNEPIRSIDTIERAKKELSGSFYDIIRNVFKGRLDKYVSYTLKNRIDNIRYKDYLTACQYLDLDMTEDKNAFPHDFNRWHDIRIDEYKTKKTLDDEMQRKEFYDQFALIADKYTPLQKMSKGAFICIIAKSPADLVREGENLHHCVGRMNYDQKFIREETLIFFIRNANEPEKPLATLEYSLSKKKILQCYGDHDSKPDEDIENFVYKKWLPYANRKLKTIAA